jgi:hypothetical protein
LNSNKSIFSRRLLLVTIGLVLSTQIFAKVQEKELEPWQLAKKTEVWKPVPEIVSAPKAKPPSDAIVLFEHNKLDSWEALKGGPAPWTMHNGVLTVKPGTGDIKTKQGFCDIQLHLEWQTPAGVEGMSGQQRNNSGVFLQQRYEVQILDSYNNSTYPNGQASSIYKQSIPLVNAMRSPGEWQYYDIIYTAPRFEGQKLKTPGYITVMHNGVLVQNHVEIQGKTEWIGAASYEAHACEPLQLQDHGNLVSFRNIWVRKL